MMKLVSLPLFRGRHILWLAVGVLWIGASCGGLLMLATYANAPGNTQQAPLTWPIDSEIGLNKRSFNLIMFAHPRCPCTRASLGELEKIVARFPGSVTPWVVFFKPAGAGESWEQTDLQTTAAQIPGVRVVSDLDGAVARHFNATTSGQTVLYNSQGELLFNGGITLARGHAGDNAGRSAVESYLRDTAPVCHQSPVFGCPIAIASEQK